LGIAGMFQTGRKHPIWTTNGGYGGPCSAWIHGGV
jgi:hypothetical protein